MLQCLFAGLSLFALSSGTLTQKKIATAESYYPLQIGNQWHFDLAVQGKQLKVSNRVTKLEKIDGKSLVRLDTISNGQVVANEHLLHTPKGLFRYRYSGIEIKPPLKLLGNPIELGATWNGETEIGGHKSVIKCTIGKQLEITKVPAGEFQTLKLDIKTTVQGKPLVTTYWFAPKVGIIKQTVNAAGNPIAIDLRKFEAAPLESAPPQAPPLKTEQP